jgi:glucose-1-phosphate cytidylyltransferase
MKKIKPGTQAVILAGGLGTRISERTNIIPKPLVTIGTMPILWHIMKTFYCYGVKDFIICGGHKIEKIHEFFKHYEFLNDDYEYNISNSTYTKLTRKSEDWNIKVLNTGHSTNTGGRLKRIKDHIKDDQPFFATYGDGVADINLTELYEFHKKRTDALVTLTSVVPVARFGAIQINENNFVTNFSEKPVGDGNIINGGFFVINKCTLDYINSDNASWEEDILPALAKKNQLRAYNHKGFWQPMDTLRDNKYLNNLWEQKKCPWKIW